MTEVLELEESKQAVAQSDMRMFYEVKRNLGICITEYKSFDDYLAAIFERASDGTLKGALQLPGSGSFDWIIEKELRKREVYV